MVWIERGGGTTFDTISWTPTFNIRGVRPATWESREDPFLATVTARPLLELRLETEGTDA